MKIAISMGLALHVLDVENEALDLSGYPSAGQEALQSAYNAGNWEPYTPPEPAPEPPPPNWTEFRLTLLQSQSFRDWSDILPDTWREDLKACAILANAEALQATYNYCITINTPGHTTATEWQGIADTNQIPVLFI